MIAVCRMAGMSAQQAFDTLGQLFNDRLASWDEAASRLPSWGPAIDPEVQKYIQGIMDVVKANLHWRSVPRVSRYQFTHWDNYFGPEIMSISD